LFKSIAMSTLPKPAYEFLRTIRNRLRSARNQRRDPADIFGEIYQKNLWSADLDQAFSGPGSRGALAEDYVSFVADYVIRHRIQSILDIGVGDFHVGRALLEKLATLGWKGSYTGCDVVKPLVDRHRLENTRTDVTFLCLDAISDPLPTAELCLIRQVLQHLSNDAAGKVLAKIDFFQHTIVSEHHPAPQNLRLANVDKATGGDVRVSQGSGMFPQFPPFNRNYRIERSLPISDGVIVNSETDAARQERLAILVKSPASPAGATGLRLVSDNTAAA